MVEAWGGLILYDHVLSDIIILLVYFNVYASFYIRGNSSAEQLNVCCANALSSPCCPETSDLNCVLFNVLISMNEMCSANLCKKQ